MTPQSPLTTRYAHRGWTTPPRIPGHNRWAENMPTNNRAQRRAKCKSLRRLAGRWSPTNPHGWR